MSEAPSATTADETLRKARRTVSKNKNRSRAVRHWRTPAVQVVCERTDGPVPRFGWQKTFDAAAYAGWEDFWAAHHRAGMDRVFELTGFDGPAGAASPEAFATFLANGLHVVRCQVCA